MIPRVSGNRFKIESRKENCTRRLGTNIPQGTYQGDDWSLNGQCSTTVRPNSGKAAAPWTQQRAHAANETLIVVANKESNITNISLSDLRALFAGEAVPAPSGGRLLALNEIPGGPSRVAFDRIVLRMSPEDISRFWVDRRIRGQGSPPRAITPAALRMQVVARFVQAISYVRIPELNPLVRPIRVDGKAHIESGYPLRLS